MRKSLIWTLVAGMTLAFAGLLYLQMTYVGEILKTRSEHFNETVKRCLYQVSKKLELAETFRYIEKDIKELYKYQPAQQTSEERFSLEIEQSTENFQSRLDVRGVVTSSAPVPSLIQNAPTNNIESASKDSYEAFKRRYLYDTYLIHEVALSMMNSTNLKAITERVDFDALDADLKLEFSNSGLDLPYVFSIIDKDGAVVYQSEEVKENEKPLASDLLTSVLFTNDPPSKQSYIKVFFPTKRSYIYGEVSFIVPSMLFSVILLLTFIFTLYIVFRQKKLSEMKTDFVNNMTHELKTPVSTISLAAQMLKDSDITKSPEVFRHISGVINDETKRLGFLVEKVLQMSLFERQRAMLKLREMDANDLIASIVNTFTLKVEKYGGRLDMDLKAEKSAMYVDETHITNVLFNLMDNAVKYRNPEVPLQLMVRTCNEGGKLQISVEDNGLGIKKEYLKKIFDRFFRVPTGNLHDVKGYGLGLAYVHKMIEDHDGTIRAESGPNNIGTKFIITLPLIKN
ncbi:MAG: HAMP domain-containing histidine kinase [Tannerellaceae bacterium]|jgi:two-component system phosphate regulon sensor histidine kinase PhoR|nr:HAMP domain-containing histidine kinase [Tannerellaceae bacterium]